MDNNNLLEEPKRIGLHVIRVRDTSEGDIIISDNNSVMIGSDLRSYFPDWHKHTEGWLVFVKA